MLRLSRNDWDFYQQEEDAMACAAPSTVAPRTAQTCSAAQSPSETNSKISGDSESTVVGCNANPLLLQLRGHYARMHPYQRELFRVSALQDSLVYLQTGGGKTWVAAAHVALHLAMHPSARVFFIVETVALAEQQANVLRQLVGVKVACVAGGAREFRSAESFCESASCRVAVMVAPKFFEWLSAKPELVTEKLASLVLLDEAHHAQSGVYRQICQQIHFLRDGITWSSNTPLHVLDDGDRRERLRDIGKRSVQATVLATALSRAAEKERQLRRGGRRDDPSVPPPHPGTPSGGVDAASPVLDLLTRQYPRDMATPQLIGLSASPVVHFKKREQEAVELLLVLRCRVVGVVEEVANLKLHRPNPALVALSYLPLYEERVLQAVLRKVMVHVYRRMAALVPEGTARSKLVALSTTSVASPGFAAVCDQFLTDVAMSEKFKRVLCFPAGSALERDVQVYVAGRAVSADGAANDSSNSSASSLPTSTLPSLSPEMRRDFCADFIFHGVRFLKAVSRALIALQEHSFEATLLSFYKDFSPEVLRSIGESCGAVTALVLHPVLRSVFSMLGKLRRKHSPPPAAAAAAVPLSQAVQAGEAGSLSPLAQLRERSTHIQLLMRLFTEFAAVAKVMAAAPGDAAERHLRVLVFVETRDTATGLMRVLSEHNPEAYAVLRPDVLLGQKSAKGGARSYMTRAEQTALLDKFRAGTVQLVFATTVAEEGIDVPACHVVMRCDRHTELRSIVQGCGRLRRRNTVFISLSNLLNGHPRLGYVLDCIRASESLLDNLACRCRDDAWRLESDELLTGKYMNNAIFPVSLPPNPNEATRLTTQEATLLVRQRDISLGLQRRYRSEIYCVHRREVEKESLSHVRVEVMMVMPVNPSGLSAGRNERRVGVLYGAATGGVVKAAQKAFVQFCQCAQKMGVLSAEGRIEGAGSADNEAYPSSASAGAEASWSGALAALNLRCSYARFATPCVVFLGSSMCLCSRMTWPVEVLRHFLHGQAEVMTVYNDDLWAAQVEPQTVLREELSAAGGSLEGIHISTGRSREQREVVTVAWPGSVSDVGSQLCSSSVPASVARTNSRGSWESSSGVGGVGGGAQERAEVRFLLPLSKASPTCATQLPCLPASANGYDGHGASTSTPTSTASRASGCEVTEEDVRVSSTDKTGKVQLTTMRHVCVRYTGPYAAKVVSLEALLRLGVQVVYNVDEDSLMAALRTCRQVDSLDE